MNTNTKEKTIITAGVNFNLKGCWLETLWSDGSISVEPMNSEQAAQWQAEHKF